MQIFIHTNSNTHAYSPSVNPLAFKPRIGEFYMTILMSRGDTVITHYLFIYFYFFRWPVIQKKSERANRSPLTIAERVFLSD